MPKTTTNQDSVLTQEETKNSATTEQSSALEAEAKAKAVAEVEAKGLADEAAAKGEAEAKRLAEEAEKAKQLDMSLPARKSLAQDALDEALQAQERINTIVSERTKELDALIIEESSLVDKNPMAEFQFYFHRQQRKRLERAEQKSKLLESGLDPIQIINALDTRAEIDKKGGGRKSDPRSNRTAQNR